MVKVVGIRELKNRLSEYLHQVKAGEEIFVTDRGEVIAEVRKPTRAAHCGPYPKLGLCLARGEARTGGPNRPDLYPVLPPLVPQGTALELLDEGRGQE